MTACNCCSSSLYLPTRSLPVMVADLILSATTSFIRLVYESCASGRDLVLWTNVQNNTTAIMITTQNTAVLIFELFINLSYGLRAHLNIRRIRGRTDATF